MELNNLDVYQINEIIKQLIDKRSKEPLFDFNNELVGYLAGNHVFLLKDKDYKLINKSLKNPDFFNSILFKTKKLFRKNFSRWASEPLSKITTEQLIEATKQPFFKTSIALRYKLIGDFKYIGYDWHFFSDKNSRTKLWIILYFYIKGAKIKSGKYKGKRNTYLLAIKFPYKKDIKNLKRLYNAPVQVFSSDPSFKYYFAYALNTLNAVITDRPELKHHLGIALTKYPKIRNPDLVTQLAKHLYKLILFIANNRPKDYLNNKYQLNINKLKIPKILQENGK